MLRKYHAQIMYCLRLFFISFVLFLFFSLFLLSLHAHGNYSNERIDPKSIFIISAQSSGLVPVACQGAGTFSTCDLNQAQILAKNIVNFFVTLAIMAFVFVIIRVGWGIIIYGEDVGKRKRELERGRKALLGIIIALLAFPIVLFIFNTLGYGDGNVFEHTFEGIPLPQRVVVVFPITEEEEEEPFGSVNPLTEGGGATGECTGFFQYTNYNNVCDIPSSLGVKGGVARVAPPSSRAFGCVLYHTSAGGFTSVKMIDACVAQINNNGGAKARRIHIFEGNFLQVYREQRGNKGGTTRENIETGKQIKLNISVLDGGCLASENRAGCGYLGVDRRIWLKLRNIHGSVGIFEPLLINSGYRSAAYNATVSDATGSRHIQGDAVDVSTRSFPTLQQKKNFLCASYRQGFQGVGVYGSHIHIDLGPRRAWNDWGSLRDYKALFLGGHASAAATLCSSTPLS